MLSQARGSSPVPSRGPEGAEDPGRGSLPRLLFLGDLWFSSIGIKMLCSWEVRMGPSSGHTTIPTQSPGQALLIGARDQCHAPHTPGISVRYGVFRTPPRGRRSQPLTLHLPCPRSPRTGLKGSTGSSKAWGHSREGGSPVFYRQGSLF